MWKVFFINFGWFSARESNNVEQAVRVARDAGFQSQIYSPQGEIVATYCPLAGLRYVDRRYAA
jgi:hypothetical protein